VVTSVSEISGGPILKITGDTFVGLIQFTRRGHVWWTSTSVRQMERWERSKVEDYCKTRNWSIEEVSHDRS
jgi:hypothetical protein